MPRLFSRYVCPVLYFTDPTWTSTRFLHLACGGWISLLQKGKCGVSIGALWGPLSTTICTYIYPFKIYFIFVQYFISVCRYQMVWKQTLQTYHEMTIVEQWTDKNVVDVPVIQTLTFKVVVSSLCDTCSLISLVYTARPAGVRSLWVWIPIYLVYSTDGSWWRHVRSRGPSHSGRFHDLCRQRTQMALDGPHTQVSIVDILGCLWIILDMVQICLCLFWI